MRRRDVADERRQILTLRDVNAHRGCLPARGLDGGDGFFRRLVVDVCHPDVRAFGCEALGDRLTDADAGARDDRNFSAETWHEALA